MRKPLTKKVGAQYPLAEMDPKAFEKAPHTRAFFLDARFEGEEGERQPGTIMIRPEASRWTATLKEPTSCNQIFLGAPTLADLWRLVEAVLADPSSPWVEDPWAKARKPAGRPKRG